MMQLTYQQWVAHADKCLTECSDSSTLDARLLLCHGLDITMTHLLSWPDRLLANSKIAPLEELLAERAEGKPIAYIVGSTEFWGISLVVNKDVLVPRADTEVIVERCLSIISSLAKPQLSIADLGTGSGAIALALAKEEPQAKVLAVDQSEQALNVAKANAELNKINNVDWLQSNWFDGMRTQRFDLIVSNPPYVAPDDKHLKDLEHEPDSALIAEDDGFADLIQIAEFAREYLLADGWLVLEHGFQQKDRLHKILKKLGYQEIQTDKDLSGNDRCTYAKCPEDG